MPTSGVAVLDHPDPQSAIDGVLLSALLTQGRGRVPADTLRWTLAPDYASVPMAREYARQALRGRYRRSPATVDDVLLAASELVANAVRHGAAHRLPGRDASLRLVLVASSSRVLCAVADPSNAAPVLRTPDLEMTGGRGLQLVEALSLCWGWTPLTENGQPAGKAVWGLFAAPSVDDEAA